MAGAGEALTNLESGVGECDLGSYNQMLAEV